MGKLLFSHMFSGLKVLQLHAPGFDTMHIPASINALSGLQELYIMGYEVTHERGIHLPLLEFLRLTVRILNFMLSHCLGMEVGRTNVSSDLC
jgi:hypothetical protein